MVCYMSENASLYRPVYYYSVIKCHYCDGHLTAKPFKDTKINAALYSWVGGWVGYVGLVWTHCASWQVLVFSRSKELPFHSENITYLSMYCTRSKFLQESEKYIYTIGIYTHTFFNHDNVYSLVSRNSIEIWVGCTSHPQGKAWEQGYLQHACI